MAFVVAVAPAVWLAGLAWDGDLGVRAVHEAIRVSGDWALRLFWLTLLVSPARRILSAPRLIRARRILGLGAFGLTILHLGLYAFELQFDWGQIGMEIVLRTYLLIGAIATIGLAALAATSTDRAIARLGSRRWNRLHARSMSSRHCRVGAFSAAVEDQHVRADADDRPVGLARRLSADPAMDRDGVGHAPAARARACARAALTAVAEIAGMRPRPGSIHGRLLAAHLDIGYGLRPAWWVLIAAFRRGSLAGSAMGARRLSGREPCPHQLHRTRRRERRRASRRADGGTR